MALVFRLSYYNDQNFNFILRLIKHIFYETHSESTKSPKRFANHITVHILIYEYHDSENLKFNFYFSRLGALRA